MSLVQKKNRTVVETESTVGADSSFRYRFRSARSLSSAADRGSEVEVKFEE